MSENKIVLDIRFVIGERSIAAEIIELDGALSNFANSETEGVTVTSATTFLESLFSRKVYIERFGTYDKSKIWSELQVLTQLIAEYQTEKPEAPPVPRIEKGKGLHNLYFEIGAAPMPIHTVHLNAVANIFGFFVEDSRFYEPKPPAPSFTSEWVKEIPVEYSFTDFKRLGLGDSELTNNFLPTERVAERANQINSESPVEVWRFTMREA